MKKSLKITNVEVARYMHNNKKNRTASGRENSKVKDLIISGHRDIYYTASALVYNALRRADIEFASKYNIDEVLAETAGKRYKNIYVTGIRLTREKQESILKAVKAIKRANKNIKWYVIGGEKTRVNVDEEFKKGLGRVLFESGSAESLPGLIKSREPVIVEDFNRLLSAYKYFLKGDEFNKGFRKKGGGREPNREAQCVIYEWDRHFTYRDDPSGEGLKEMIKKLAFGKFTAEDFEAAARYNYIYVDIVYNSPRMREVQKLVEKTGKAIQKGMNRVNILIHGETGSGKDVIARQLHKHGRGGGAPYRVVNCAAIPENLLESELFGHEKGAFTGAEKKKRGAFELADGGTIFLDEITEMPLSLQAKLLRAIETYRIPVLGSENEIEVDVMVITATNKNIKQLIKEKKFRLDFYQRISSVEIFVPPLRERKEDIRILAEYYSLLNEPEKGQRLILTSNQVKMLKEYWWPGNVRQLMKFLDRWMIFYDGKDGTFRRILDDMQKGDEYLRYEAEDVSYDYRMKDENEIMTLEEGERILIIRALKHFDYNIEKTRDALGLGSRNTLVSKMQKYGIETNKKNGGDK